MASNGDILRLIATSTLGGQLVQNVYHYLVDNIVGSGSSDFINSALRSQWRSVVLPPVKLIQNDAIQYSQIEVQNLNDVAGDELFSFSESGLQAGESLPSLVSWSYQLRPEDKSIRHGRKSIAGVPELEVAINEPTPGVLPALIDVGVQLATTLVHPNADFVPVVARILPASVRPFLPYAVPVAEGIFRGIGTQYSRKKGRGA